MCTDAYREALTRALPSTAAPAPAGDEAAHGGSGTVRAGTRRPLRAGDSGLLLTRHFGRGAETAPAQLVDQGMNTGH